MNVFIIPSWYPSLPNPLAGIFFKEQAQYLAQHSSDLQVGVSLWGQENKELILSKKDVFNAPAKIIRFLSLQPQRNLVAANLTEYYQPVLQWSKKIWQGNFASILKANSRNLESFLDDHGRVDIIHAHVSFPGGFIARELSKRFAVPFVITEHMGPFPFADLVDSTGELKEKVAGPLRSANMNIAVSPALATRMVAFGIPAPVFIPNVVDEDFFQPSNELFYKEGFTFFCLGSMEFSKGIGDLIAALEIVCRTMEGIHLRIGGSGPDLETFKIMAQDAGLADKITWLGRLSREQAREEYQRSDAFILPSHHESFGLVYAEAMACGKPVIATRCGGPEVIVNAQNGLLAPIGNSKELAARMKEMTENISQYHPAAVRADFMERFSKKAVIPQLLELYNQVAER
jgi:glycosyltransferase involved in cell wall biosynthesis